MIPFGIERKCVLFVVSLYTLYPLLFNRSYSNFGANTETDESILDVVEEEEEDEWQVPEEQQEDRCFQPL